MASDEEIRAALSPLLRDVCEVLEQDMGRIRPVPDLEDVLARAHAMDPARIPEPEPSNEVPFLTRRSTGQAWHRTEGTTESPGFDAFLGEVRAHVEGMTTERAMRHIPTFRNPREVAGRRLAVTVGASLLAVAAVVLAVTGVVALGERLTRTQSVEATLAADQVEARSEERSVVLQPAPKTRTRTQKPPAVEPNPAQETADSEDGEIVILEEEESQTEAAGSLAERLSRLDADAQALWRAGDRAGAELKLREIVRIGGRSRRAELAFGDLFTLSYQLRGASSRAALWRRYLSRFPRGDYADDARAGLCRLATGDEALECWRRYVADWPHGAHRQEARAALR
jgi:hypothetical protein